MGRVPGQGALFGSLRSVFSVAVLSLQTEVGPLYQQIEALEEGAEVVAGFLSTAMSNYRQQQHMLSADTVTVVRGVQLAQSCGVF